MRHRAEGLFRQVYAARIAHVSGLFGRINDAWVREAPIARRGKRHGGINECITKLGCYLLA